MKLLLVVTLATGIATSAVMYGVVDLFVWAPPSHVESPEDLRILGRASTFRDFSILRDHAQSVEVAAFRSRRAALGVDAAERDVAIECVTAGYFDLLGTHTAVGESDLGSERTDPAAPLRVVVSHALWRQQFASESNIVGRDISINGRHGRIAGIAPRGFQGLVAAAPDLWISLAAAPDVCALHGSLESVSITLVARLRQGIGEPAVIAELKQLVPGEPSDGTQWLKSLSEARLAYVRADARAAACTAVAAVLLLVIACVNVASLLVLDADRRRNEMALRIQLGATPGRIARLLLLEQFPIAGTSVVLGVALAVTMLLLLRDLTPFGADSLAINLKLSGLLLFLGIGASFATACVPVLYLLRGALSTRPHSASITTRWRRSDLALGAQWALAFALIAAAWQIEKGIRSLLSTAGYEPASVVVANIDTRSSGFVAESDLEDSYRRLADRARQLPEVVAAGVGSVDLWAPTLDYAVTVVQAAPGAPISNGRALPVAIIQAVSTEYFDALGMKLTAGHAWDAAGRTEPVVIVDQLVADTTWPNQNPIGRCAYPVGTSECVRVVGVSVPRRGLLLEHKAPEVFVPIGQTFGNGRPRVSRAMFVRVGVPLDSVVPQLSRALKDAALPLPITIERMADRADALSKTRRLSVAMFTWCGVAATLISAIGLYAALAFRVRSRTQEIGLRLALGAPTFRAVWPAFSNALLAVACGALAGIGIVAASGRMMESLLFEVRPLEITNLSAAGLILGVATLLGLFVPALRATRISPAVSLRQQ